MYLEYLEFKNPNSVHEIKISKFHHNKKTSYVFVRDVAKVIDILLKKNIQNEILNLGFDQAMSINDVLELIASFLKHNMEKRIICVPVDNCANYIYEPFPSVTKGPVNTSKIKQLLEFEFSDLNNCFEESVEFYNSAYSKFNEERHQIEKELKKEWIKEKFDRELFSKFIDHHLN